MHAARRLFSLRALLGVLVIIAGVNVSIFVLERWVVLPLRVPSASMEPALRSGDRILVARVHASDEQLRKEIDRGDVLVFKAPHKGAPLTVKRVIGLPGETIEAHSGVIAIDDERVLVERWLPKQVRDVSSSAAQSLEIPRTTLGDDEVYVLGDNRDHSIDSRSFGPIRLELVVGRVLVRFWPPGRYGKVDWL